MKINSDFRDLLRDLNAAGVRYLIVGGYAVMVHRPHYRMDPDPPAESSILHTEEVEQGMPSVL